jgi:hypothetical protein
MGVAPAVPEAVREPVSVDEIARIRYPGPPIIDGHIDLFFGQERPFLADGHFLDDELFPTFLQDVLPDPPFRMYNTLSR